MTPAGGAALERLQDPVELGSDGAQPLGLVPIAPLARDRQQRVLLPDEPLDPGEQPGLGRPLDELVGARGPGRERCA